MAKPRGSEEVEATADNELLGLTTVRSSMDMVVDEDHLERKEGERAKSRLD